MGASPAAIDRRASSMVVNCGPMALAMALSGSPRPAEHAFSMQGPCVCHCACSHVRLLAAGCDLSSRRRRRQRDAPGLGVRNQLFRVPGELRSYRGARSSTGALRPAFIQP